MSDERDNVRSLGLKRIMKPMMDSMKALSDAQNESSRNMAVMMNQSNTRGFYWLMTQRPLEDANDDPLTDDAIRAVVANFNKLPRDAVRDFHQRWEALDKVYGGNGEGRQVFDIAYRMITEHAVPSKIIDIWLEIDSGWEDAKREAEAVAMQAVITETQRMLPNYDYLEILQIVRDWYT